MAHVENTDFTGTPFNPRTAPLNINQRWTAWDIYHVVDVFSDVATELKAIREAAVVIDMSPLAKYDISGPDAKKYINYLITRDASKIGVNQVYYTPWCDHDGKLVSDGMVFRMNTDTFRVTGDPCYSWFRQNTEGFDVIINDVTHERGILSLQGPKTREILEAASGEDWSDFKFSRVRVATIGGVEVEVARQGFTGEHGYELCVAKEDGVPLWDAIMTAGHEYGIKPAGFISADISRMEAGLIIPGPDYTKGGMTDDRGAAIEVDIENKSSPYEVRLGHFVELDKECDFLGKTALSKEDKNRSDMIGLLIDWQNIAELYTKQRLPPVVVANPIWYPLSVIKDGKKIGRATSIAWSPAAQSIAGFGFLDIEFCKPSTEVKVEFKVQDEISLVNAKVVKLPFLDLQRTK